MDKYDAANDHYCYRGSSTLKTSLTLTIWMSLKKQREKLQP